MKGPYSLRAITGYEIEVMWEEPDITYGLLQKFVINAYVMDSGEEDFVFMEVNAKTLEGKTRGEK